ncbi:MAG: TraR/DksA C4-type zinc finger protein [Gemmatimonadales bacterium]|nr:TraR/DksA C4-type zinc finger protein [Gemmatimonadales bacterium]
MAMTEDQLQYLETRLREERERVAVLLRRYDERRSTSQLEASGDLSEYPFHMADHGTDTYDQEMGAMLAQRASRELEEIDDALHRLVETPDRFGICENTGEAIPFERLDLIPWARTCRETEAR